MKQYQNPHINIFMVQEDVICISGGGDGDVDMSTLFGPIFGNDNTDVGGES